jgi:hypothetical protein
MSLFLSKLNLLGDYLSNMGNNKSEKNVFLKNYFN